MYAAVPKLSALNVAGAAALAAAASASCASDGPRRRHRTPEPEPSASAAPQPLGAWPHFGELSSFKEIGYASHSAHRLGDDAATIWANAAANPALVAAQEKGAILVAALSPAVDGPATEYFVMEKVGDGAPDSAAGWQFAVVNPEGQLEARGALPLCVRCHEEAGPTLVFPSPGPATPPTGPAPSK